MTTKTEASRTKPRPKTTSAPAPEAAPGDVLKQALELAEQQRQRDAARAAANAAGRWREYLELLTRAGEPRKDDARRLGELMVALEVTSEQAEADLKLIGKYSELRTRHADREAARERWVKASTHARELEKKLHEELAEARREAGLAQHELSVATQAHFDLHMLQRTRPQLFAGEIGEQYRSDAPVAELLSSTPTP